MAATVNATDTTEKEQTPPSKGPRLPSLKLANPFSKKKVRMMPNMLRGVMTEFGPKNIFILSIKLYFCPFCIKTSNNLSILPVLEGLADILMIVCMSFKVPVLRLVHIFFPF